MEFDKDLAAVHAYLCSDGYVIRNPETQKHKYYYVGFRNTNIILLKDFQRKFNNYFGLKPILIPKERCKIQSKEIYHNLIKQFSSFYSYTWQMPKLNKEHLQYWLRAFFDCESWVECQKHKSRLIGLECVNSGGISSIQKALLRFDIGSTLRKRKNRNIYRLCICGFSNLKKFKENIGFLHPRKRRLLPNALNSYTKKHIVRML